MELVSDEFWESEWSCKLHGPTVRRMIREDLSKDLGHPITLNEIWAIARREMNYDWVSTTFQKGEVANPLCTVASVWAFKHLGLSRKLASSLGIFIGMYAGGDTFAPLSDRLALKAEVLLLEWTGDTRDPETTRAILQRVIEIYRSARVR